MRWVNALHRLPIDDRKACAPHLMSPYHLVHRAMKDLELDPPWQVNGNALGVDRGIAKKLRE
jgi:hypothetical protein